MYLFWDRVLLCCPGWGTISVHQFQSSQRFSSLPSCAGLQACITTTSYLFFFFKMGLHPERPGCGLEPWPQVIHLPQPREVLKPQVWPQHPADPFIFCIRFGRPFKPPDTNSFSVRLRPSVHRFLLAHYHSQHPVCPQPQHQGWIPNNPATHKGWQSSNTPQLSSSLEYMQTLASTEFRVNKYNTSHKWENSVKNASICLATGQSLCCLSL